MDIPVIQIVSAANSKDTSPSSPVSPFSRVTIKSSYKTKKTSSNIKRNPKPAYKDINLDPTTIPDKSEIRWKPVVSFDSIPLILNNEDINNNYDYISDAELSDTENSASPSYDETYSRGRSLSPYRSASPHRSPSPYAQHLTSNVLDGIVHGGYPTSPVISIDSFLYTRQTPGYIKYVKENGKRVILCYITGRRHTWVALDYIIAELLKRGDELVIISRIPDDYRDLTFPHDEHYYKLKYQNHKRERKDRGLETNEKIKDKQSYFKQIIDDLIQYIELLIPQHSIDQLDIKLTIDFYLSNSTFKVIDECVDIYHPAFLAITSKPNLRFSRTTTWKSSRISDRLVKSFDVPILIVPSLTMNQFEVKLFENLSKTKKLNFYNNSGIIPVNLDKSYSTNPSFTSFKHSHKFHTSNNNSTTNGLLPSTSKKSTQSQVSTPLMSEASSIVSDVDSSDDDDDESDSSMTSSVRELTRTFSGYKEVLDTFFEEINETEIDNSNSDIFYNKLNKVIDITKKMGLEFQNYSNTDNGEGAELVRSLTGLPKVYRTKSMLDEFDDLQTKNQNSINKLKNSLHPNDHHHRPLLTRNLSSPPGSDSNSPPPSRAIKFSSDLTNPKLAVPKFSKHSSANSGLVRYTTNVDDDSLRPSKSSERNKLSKSLSEANYLSDNLRQFHSAESVDVIKKKKKGSLFKFFSRSK